MRAGQMINHFENIFWLPKILDCSLCADGVVLIWCAQHRKQLLQCIKSNLHFSLVFFFYQEQHVDIVTVGV